MNSKMKSHIVIQNKEYSTIAQIYKDFFTFHIFSTSGHKKQALVVALLKCVDL